MICASCLMSTILHSHPPQAQLFELEQGVACSIILACFMIGCRSRMILETMLMLPFTQTQTHDVVMASMASATH